VLELDFTTNNAKFDDFLATAELFMVHVAEELTWPDESAAHTAAISHQRLPHLPSEPLGAGPYH
jgi:hypothetical protein